MEAKRGQLEKHFYLAFTNLRGDNEVHIANSLTFAVVWWNAKRGWKPYLYFKEIENAFTILFPTWKSANGHCWGMIGNKRSRKSIYKRELLLYYLVSRCLPIPLSQIRRAMVCAFCLLGNKGSKICEDIAFRYICTCPSKPRPSEAAVDDVQEKRKSVTILFLASKIAKFYNTGIMGNNAYALLYIPMSVNIRLISV